jgi:hypothetical protein
MSNTLNVSGRTTFSNIVVVSSNIRVEGNIGIGTSSPAVALEIRRTDAILIPHGTTVERPALPTAGHIRYNIDTSQFEGFGAGAAWGSLGGVKSTDQQTFISAETYPTSNDGNLRFVNSNVESMRITQTRNVGIATTTPAERLDIAGNSIVRSNLYVMSNLGVGISNPQATVDIVGTTRVTGTLVTVGSCIIRKGTGSNVVTNTIGWAAASNGVYTLSNVGIGTTDPSYPLHVMSQSNNVSIYAQFGVTQFSDIRIKKDLRRIRNALDKVNAISGYTFLRSDVSSNRRCCGVIAQEIAEVLPEVVHRDNKSGLLGVSYGDVVPLLIEAIKDLTIKCENQEARIKTLESL